MSDKCEICEGSGRYPVIDCHGTERYSITCPECYGSGAADEPDDAGEKEQFEYAPSTAAKMASMMGVREYIDQWNKR